MRHATVEQGTRPPSAPGSGATAIDYSNGYIISSDCMDCGVCEFMCPQGAIFEAKRQFVIRKDACNGCGDCVPYCPARAIVPRASFHDRQDRTVRNVLGAILGEGSS